jgi:hypothetical protein
VSIPAALATSSGLPVKKPRAKLAARLAGLAASRSADSIFPISAGAMATPRSRLRSTKLRASSMSPAPSAASISRAATAALNCRSRAMSESRTGSSMDAMSRAASTPCGRLTPPASARHAAVPSENVMARRVSKFQPLALPHLGRD